MKSIPLALTWEFWRQAWSPLLTQVALLIGLMVFLYDGFALGHVGDLQIVGFIFVVVGVVAAICGATAPPKYRFALPVSTSASILIPMINGAAATAISYLTVALLLNGMFDAHWALVKPTIIAVCIFSLCQGVAWMIWSSSILRSGVVACVCIFLSVWTLSDRSSEVGYQYWGTLRPLDVVYLIVVASSACLFSLGAMTLARRGHVLSMTASGRWLLAKLKFPFGTGSHRMTPMAAASWAEWITRGYAMPAASALIAMILCVFFLSGRFPWRSACDGIVAFTWLQVVGGSIVGGLFLGHVGQQFDFHEHFATRPLSDIQLADAKLWNTLKSVAWTWITWATGVVVAIACLILVGQGPDWSRLFRPNFAILFLTLTIPLFSWTLTSLGVSIAILRPWTVKTVFIAGTLLPIVPITVLYLWPQLEYEVVTAMRWAWVCTAVGGTCAIYVTAFRRRLITAKRIVLTSLAYLLLCAAWTPAATFQPSSQTPLAEALGLLLSLCLLPFVSIAAVPLAIWWNRHR